MLHYFITNFVYQICILYIFHIYIYRYSIFLWLMTRLHPVDELFKNIIYINYDNDCDVRSVCFAARMPDMIGSVCLHCIGHDGMRRHKDAPNASLFIHGLDEYKSARCAKALTLATLTSTIEVTLPNAATFPPIPFSPLRPILNALCFICIIYIYIYSSYMIESAKAAGFCVACRANKTSVIFCITDAEYSV